MLWLGKVCPRVLATLPRSPDRDLEAGARLGRPQHEVARERASVTTSVSSGARRVTEEPGLGIRIRLISQDSELGKG